MTDTGWHFTKGDGKSNGPHKLEELRNLIDAGQLADDTLVWHESLDDWTAVASVPILAPSRKDSTPPPPPPPPAQPPVQSQKTSSGSFERFIDKTRDRVESIYAKAVSPASNASKTDTWGTVGSIAGALSGGLLLVGLCFTPMACCAVPVSIGGIASSLFSDNIQLRKIGLIGNSIVLFLSLAIVIWLSFSMAFELRRLDRF